MGCDDGNTEYEWDSMDSIQWDRLSKCYKTLYLDTAKMGTTWKMVKMRQMFAVRCPVFFLVLPEMDRQRMGWDQTLLVIRFVSSQMCTQKTTLENGAVFLKLEELFSFQEPSSKQKVDVVSTNPLRFLKKRSSCKVPVVWNNYSKTK